MLDRVLLIDDEIHLSEVLAIRLRYRWPIVYVNYLSMWID